MHGTIDRSSRHRRGGCQVPEINTREAPGLTGESGGRPTYGETLDQNRGFLGRDMRIEWRPVHPSVLQSAQRPGPNIRRYERAKRLIDLVLSLLALPFVGVVLAICVVAIRLESPGPAFFVQPRTGRGGKRFGMYKLRTMVRDAEERKAELAHLNQLSFPDFKIPDDPRITRVGRVLRRTSLDELPQLLNVIKGEMSLVGPRPTSFTSDTYRLWHTERLEVRPGITGLWQVSGRSDIDFDERLRLDIHYIRNRSLVYDLRLLLLTFGAVFRRRGAS
jgi:lipopolysaccharide/colanic/teichoic acid biosynthesis glycosyltransferase